MTGDTKPKKVYDYTGRSRICTVCGQHERHTAFSKKQTKICNACLALQKSVRTRKDNVSELLSLYPDLNQIAAAQISNIVRGPITVKSRYLKAIVTLCMEFEYEPLQFGLRKDTLEAGLVHLQSEYTVWQVATATIDLRNPLTLAYMQGKVLNKAPRLLVHGATKQSVDYAVSRIRENAEVLNVIIKELT